MSPPAAERMRATFDAVEDLTVGLEEEILLVDPRSFELVPQATAVLARLGGDPRFKLELPASQLEIVTPPAHSVGEAVAGLAAGRAAVRDRAGGVASAIGAGVHPCAAREGELNTGGRYDLTAEDYRAIARRQLVCALQVHVAVRGSERALAVYNALRSFLPEIAALAANAPFEGGHDTGMASVRPTISAMLPRQGVPPALAGWDDFAAQLRWGAAAGSVPEPRRWWWELRPHPSYGTLEVRVADTQICSADSAGVVAFVQTLVAWLAQRFDDGERFPTAPSWRIAENRWAALRDGVAGSLADLESGERSLTRTRLLALCETLAPVAERLGCAAELTRSAALVETNGALAQREFAAANGIAALPSWLSARFAE